MREGLLRRGALAAICFWGNCALGVFPTEAQNKGVTLHVRIQNESPEKGEKTAKAAVNESGVVAWLRPLDPSEKNLVAEQAGKRPQVIQKNKSFQPHLTVVPVGSVVDFPNHDPFFHNVFSLFDGKRFDLGLYEAGATNSVRFDHVGVSYLFCNIHPEMSAIVVALDTPYYAVSERSGIVTIANVPDGKYELRIWYERSAPEALKGLARTVNITADSRDLGTIAVPLDIGFTTVHKNKYGQDYAPPPKEGYPQP